ncbi:MAG TPA: hypothetical protein VNR59_13360 [Gaiellaceae bacterium]|nr:hypothetical protein [Gaiellaceae bacterium]
MTIFRASLVAAAALALASAAYGAYPGTYAQLGSLGAIGVTTTGNNTSVSGGASSVVLEGAYGIPTLITTGTQLGLSHDGSQLVLQSMNRKQTSFVVLRTRDLSVMQTISLQGSFAFDALSPNARTLYLIEHRSTDLQHYVVRAYDLVTHTLRPGRIADKTQKSWVMQGWPTSRVATADGRWVYTLYTNPGGFPFVHALDTVRGVAHCVGMAWEGSQNPLYHYRLGINGSRLLVMRGDGSVYRSINRTTWAVSLR